MTPTTLQALRRLLFFSVPEAARWIAASPERPAGVTERAWRMWEAGTWPVPQDVIDRIGAMLAWRKRALAEAEKAIAEARAAMAAQGGEEAAPGQITWYVSAAAWAKAEPRSPDMWRPHCSVVAELCARHSCEAVPSD
jgi:hypothetical protein